MTATRAAPNRIAWYNVGMNAELMTKAERIKNSFNGHPPLGVNATILSMMYHAPR